MKTEILLIPVEGAPAVLQKPIPVQSGEDGSWNVILKNISSVAVAS